MLLRDLTPLPLENTNLVGFSVKFDKARYVDNAFQDYAIQFPASMNRAVDKRKAEYLAGRYCAQQCLQHLGAKTTLVTTGPMREPVWPRTNADEVIIGSISHSNGTALCIAALHQHITHLGIDFEHFMSEKLAQDLHKTLISDIEKSRLDALELPFEHALTIVFSAKESIFKTLFPDVQNYFGFEAAEFLSINDTYTQATFLLTEDLTSIWKKGTRLLVEVKKGENNVLTSIVIPRR